MNYLDILNGHIKELFNQEEILHKHRINICKTCPLFITTSLGLMCNNELWIDKYGHTSCIEKEDYVRGCGCRLDAKTRLTNAKCIINKW